MYNIRDSKNGAPGTGSPLPPAGMEAPSGAFLAKAPGTGVTLLEHNMTPYVELKSSLEKNSCVMLTSCPGAGKSFVIMKLMEDFPENAVVVCPTKAIAHEWEENAGANGVNINTTTYQALNNMEETQLGYLAGRYRYIVFDECHHVGAEKWQKNILFLKSRFPDNRLIGLTATPIRYLDGARDVGEEFFDSNVVHGQTQLEAVKKGILPGFTYVCGVFALAEHVRELKEKAGSCEKTDAFEKIGRLEYCAQNINEVHDAFDKYMPEGDRKGIVFVDRVERLGQAMAAIQGYYGGSALCFTIHSRQSWQKNRNELEAFKDTGAGWMFAVDMLNEGVHIPGVNTIVMFRKTVSPAVYIQQIGRGQAASSGKSVVFDFVGNRKNLKAMGFTLKPGSGTGTARMHYKEDPCVIIDFIETDACQLLWEVERELNKNKSWTPEEDRVILEHYKDGVDKCMELLPDRTKGSIKARAGVLGTHNHTRWTPEEDFVIREHYKDGVDKCMELLPDRTKGSIKARAGVLGITRNHIRWTPEEDFVIREHYKDGVDKCMELLPDRAKDSIMARARKLGTRNHIRWTPEEDFVIREHYKDGVDKCTDLLPGRTKDSIKSRAGTLGTARNYTKWTPEEDCVIRKYYKDGVDKCMELLPGRTKDSIIARAGMLGTRNHIRWTPEEDRVILEHYKDGIDKCTELLPGRTKDSIKSRASMLGTARNYTKWTPEEDRVIREHYKDGVDKCMELLPDRTKRSIKVRAGTLGTARNYTKWTPEEDCVIREHYKDGIDKCMELLPGRTKDSIRNRAGMLGARNCTRWTPEEDRVIREHYKDGVDKCMELLPGRTKDSIRNQAGKLGARNHAR